MFNLPVLSHKAAPVEERRLPSANILDNHSDDARAIVAIAEENAVNLRLEIDRLRRELYRNEQIVIIYSHVERGLAKSIENEDAAIS